ncbi:bile acid:sodium symporter family protein [Sphingomonas sp. Root710]|uniref:bile acid:sodium symporter family protein n=1 Tax=Sphingomonas sp. Root710 TaxID=1736594 RepID=UPI001F3A1426|nr:bile acid:sodium symporter [Sphingomonas sp. Root710]
MGIIGFVNGVLIPIGLALIMFSMGLTLRLADFAFAAGLRRLVAVGVAAHMLLLPLLGLAVGRLFGLEHELALAVFIIAICPTGTTSNALTFVGGGNVALAVVLTAISSLITVFTIPLLLAWAIPHFMDGAGKLPELSMLDTIAKLVRITVLPIAIGMVVRSRWPDVSISLARKLKPTAFIVLLAMLGFSIAISFDMVIRNAIAVGPAMFALNVLALASGLLIGRLMKVGPRDQMTLAIEVGVQNATLALFLTATVLGSLELSISQNVYGVLMLANAGILIRLFRARIAAEASTE